MNIRFERQQTPSQREKDDIAYEVRRVILGKHKDLKIRVRNGKIKINNEVPISVEEARVKFHPLFVPKAVEPVKVIDPVKVIAESDKVLSMEI